MYFTLGVETTILFKAWTVETVAGLITSCIAVCVIAFLFEAIKALRMILDDLLQPERDTRDSSEVQADHSEKTPILGDDGDSPQMCSLAHGVQTVCHVIQLAVAYSLMLIMMTYNGWLAISILFGAGLGYFMFGGQMSKRAMTVGRTKSK